MRFLDPLGLGDFFLEEAPVSFWSPLPSSYSTFTCGRLRTELEVAREDVSLEGWPTVDVLGEGMEGEGRGEERGEGRGERVEEGREGGRKGR